MREYENLGFYPENVKTDFSNDIHGICHDENYWYVSHESSIQIVPFGGLDKDLKYVERKQPFGSSIGLLLSKDVYKYYQSNSSTNPVGLKVDGVCFGDIDCYKGYLFVPVFVKNGDEIVDTKILVFSIKTFDCVCCETLCKLDNVKFKKMAWCAINPQDDCLYTSDSILSSSFDGCKSPVMAFKINFENLEKRKYPVFSCVDKNGIALKRKVKTNTNNLEIVPCEFGSEIQAGCFDPFDTLYLCSDSASCQEYGAVSAFTLQRELESTVDKFIRDRAYFIWEEKGRPLQSESDKKKDWFDAVWQINAMVQSGLKKYDGPAYAGLSYEKNGDLDSMNHALVMRTFDEDPFEKVRGISYWDNRRFTNDSDDGLGNRYGNLHVLKIKTGVASTYSMQNFSLRNFETVYEIINYDPKTLKIKYNKVSNRWAIVSRDIIPVKAFETEAEAKNALPLISQFKSLVVIGRCSSNEERYDLCYDVLYERCSNLIKLDDVKKVTIHFDSIQVTHRRCVVENKWKSDCVIAFNLKEKQIFNQSYPKVYFPVHNEDVALLIKEIIMTNSNYSKYIGGYLNYILSSSNRQKDNLYWFD